MESFRRRVTVEYAEDICETEELPAVERDGYAVPARKTTRTVGRKRMRCDVEIVIDLESVARVMGSRAASSKGGRCQDGYVVVKRVGDPMELSREAK